MKRNMTIPSRPAPAPPQSASTVSRYTPTTNWDDTPFQQHRAPPFSQPQNAKLKQKKVPPPRPPLPKIASNPMPELKKPHQPQSINILSNLFGSTAKKSASNQPNSKVITKLPPPPPTNHHHHHRPHSMTPVSTPSSTMSDFQLINFDSPPGSPTLTQKSNSDCISVDSFSSDSNYSSPHNGSMSQAESGFEDDFNQSVVNKDPWDVFSATAPAKTNITTGKTSVGGSSFYASTATIRALPAAATPTEFLDPLCNGKTAVPKVQTKVMPTIIKPTIPVKPTSEKLRLHDIRFSAPPAVSSSSSSSYFAEIEEDDLPSLPMPNCPPPPPPSGVADDLESDTESYGITLYDFNGEQDDDLSFRANEKIYLLKRLNDEWLFGRDKRGCEGMFPVNYIDIKVPLCDDKTTAATRDISSKSNVSTNVRVLYSFNAEVAEDLSLKENDMVTVLYRITPEWLFGEVDGRRGQFPANFIEFIPENLPQMPSH